jgi:UDP-glucuronate 4-epimerase
MSILVTGGAGFIGSHLIERLDSESVSAVCLDNFNEFYSPQLKRRNLSAVQDSDFIEIVEGDIRDEDLVGQVFGSYDIDAVVHLAALAGVRPSIENPLLYEEVNCRGTLNLLECASEADVERFVFGSSSSVYGVNQKVPFSEDDPVPNPISPYAATKRAGELFCHVHHHLTGMPVICLRFFTVYGPRQRPDLAIHKFTRLMHEDKTLPLYGDGSSRRDYTYVTDIVDGIMASLRCEVDFEIVNLGGEDPISLNKLVSLIEDAMGKEARVEHLPDQPGDVPITYADISKARKLLNYEPQFPIGKGIENFVTWYRETNA